MREVIPHCTSELLRDFKCFNHKGQIYKEIDCLLNVTSHSVDTSKCYTVPNIQTYNSYLSIKKLQNRNPSNSHLCDLFH